MFIFLKMLAIELVFVYNKVIIDLNKSNKFTMYSIRII